MNRRSFLTGAFATTALSALAGCASASVTAANPNQAGASRSSGAAQSFAPVPTASAVPAATAAASGGSFPAIHPVPSPTTVSPSATPRPPTSTPAPAAPIPSRATSAPLVTAAAIAIVDGASGALLYDKDAHGSYPPASLTKIITALVALRHGRLEQEITANYDPAQLPDSTLMGIKPGERYTLEDLLYGLLLPSGGDAALAIANAIGGSVPSFVAMMNAEATRLGLRNSNFVNPHGLDAPDLRSSAYDMAIAGRFGTLTYPIFRTIVGTRAWDVHGTRSFEIYNLNKFLWNYQGADGVKIGYTDLAGRTIVASATRNGHQVIVSLMRLGDYVGDTVPLFNWAYESFKWPGGE